MTPTVDRKSTRLNSSHANIYTLSLHDALPISQVVEAKLVVGAVGHVALVRFLALLIVETVHNDAHRRSEEHTSELQSRQYLHSFPTRRSSDLAGSRSQARCWCRRSRRTRTLSCVAHRRDRAQ